MQLIYVSFIYILMVYNYTRMHCTYWLRGQQSESENPFRLFRTQTVNSDLAQCGDGSRVGLSLPRPQPHRCPAHHLLQQLGGSGGEKEQPTRLPSPGVEVRGQRSECNTAREKEREVYRARKSCKNHTVALGTYTCMAALFIIETVRQVHVLYIYI